MLFKNRRVINIIALAILTIVLCVVVYIQYFSATPPPEGAFRVVKCPGCGAQYEKMIKDINDSRDANSICSKCKKPLGYAYKCDDCDFEFPVIPAAKPSASEISKMKTMGKLKYVLQARKCPNCGSTSTVPISVKSK